MGKYEDWLKKVDTAVSVKTGGLDTTDLPDLTDLWALWDAGLKPGEAAKEVLRDQNADFDGI